MNLTIQWCVSSEALDTYHHAFGATWGGRNSSFHHNLFACDTGRNPSVGMGYDFNFTNNVLYNWRHRTCDGGDDTTRPNIINNYYRPGPTTPDAAIRHRVAQPASRRPTKNGPDLYGKWYVAGNIVEGDARVTADNWDGGVQFRLSGAELAAPAGGNEEKVKALLAEVRADKPFALPSVTLQTAEEAYPAVLADAGATLPRRDAVDARIVEEVRSGTVTYAAGQGIITDVSQVGGYPPYRGDPSGDVGSDGIPTWWKRRYGLNPNDPAEATRDCNGDGYTNVEKYLNGMDPTQRLDFKDPKNNVSTLTRSKLRPPAPSSP